MAFFRALESARPADTRLFSDPFAIHFLRPGLRRAVAVSRLPVLGTLLVRLADRRLPGARTSGVARTRFIDDALRRALRQGIAQVVVLGAGFDCRAYRLPELAAAVVFEVDHPGTLAMKLDRLRSALGRVPDRVRFVAIDFNRQGLPEVLESAGLDRLRPAAFLWEGVTNYLAPEAVDAVLRYVGRRPAGTRLIFTYVHRGALEGDPQFADAPALLRDVARLGEPWTFGLEPAELPSYLRERGLQLESDTGARDYRLQCFGPPAARMKGYDFYRVAVAGVRGDTGNPSGLAASGM
jgi:methyltransferase (TIGR00027 family)